MLAPHSAATPPLGPLGTLAAFGLGALVMLAVARGLIPWLDARSTAEPILLWLFAGGALVFAPMLLAAGLLLRRERLRRRESQPEAPATDIWRQRLRFRRMTRGDWLWTLGGLAAISVLALVIVLVLRAFLGPDIALHPQFMQMAPLTADRAWILALWLPVWALNIMGEEILWRGVLLPRQELAMRRWAWLANGAGWLVFHLAFGPVIMQTLAPIALILPWIVQRRGNSWIGVVVHAGLNGAGFVAMAFGLV